MALKTLRFSLIGAAATALCAGAAVAQVSDSNVRAVNLARNWAINNNGGLSVYRPADCMFNTGNGGGSCLIQSNNPGYTFRFMGGAPGWQQEGMAPTTETEVTVSPDGRSITNVGYNGTPR
ncbi:MAG: hypothetical protein KXJ50_06680 [Vulcanococcus sp.]|uniref:hypothetical protein n=1 Tax=Vulcanococcus sp. TaxID=2856995 RepID=UPI0025CBEC01|nr:hypothetical protein [Vulcanococcus sp.]MBW0173995.1 hypothetical protein [Vulcanococcus sp.]MBW0180737.1 hypothetical protein [Vulcanococcus sp.]